MSFSARLLSLFCACFFLSCSLPLSKKHVSIREAHEHAILQQLLLHHQQWQGTPYKDGGSGRDGIDCSAFTQITFAKLFNTPLPRSTDEQIEVGRSIPLSQLMAGDLLFFTTGWFTSHVGIYLRNGEFLHASTSRGVTISSLQDEYWNDAFDEARRVPLFL